MSLAQRKNRSALPGLSVWQRVRGVSLTWNQFGLFGLMALSAILNFYQLGQSGYTNEYYAAATRSMLTSWSNFFFNAYDPGGFITIDKPPVAFWFEAASAWLFGFSGWSILVPSALAGMASVALIYYLVKRTFGPVAGLFAGLALAVTPIFTVMARHNNPESILILFMVLGAWAVTMAAEKGRLRWLILSMVMIGIAFNVKMLEAFVVLPAFYLMYFLMAKTKWWKRIVHLGLATVVLAAVSLSWAVAVDLTPASSRPYVGGSSTNSVIDLMLNYNGLDRIEGNTMGGGTPGGNSNGGPQSGGQPPANFQPPTQNGTSTTSNGSTTTMPAFNGNTRPNGGNGGMGGNGNSSFTAGSVGPFRMFESAVAGEAGWLLPLALMGIVLVTAQAFTRFKKGPERTRRLQTLMVWGGWLLTFMAVFSIEKGIFHAYYLVMLAPAVAALAGMSLEALWYSYRRGGGQRWLMPVALIISAAFEMNILGGYSDWNRTIALVVAGIELACAAALIVVPVLFKRLSGRWTAGIAAIGFLSLLVAPLSWAIHAVMTKTYSNSTLPTAVPTGSSSSNLNLFTTLQAHWNGWLSSLVIALAVVALVMLIGRFVRSQFKGRQSLTKTMAVFAAAVVISLGLSMALNVLPTPSTASASTTLPSVGIIGNPQMAMSSNDKLIAYLEANQGGYEYLVATASSQNASGIIIETGMPVMALGGFSGTDKVITTAEQIQALVNSKTVRYFLLDGGGMGGGRGGSSSTATSWVTSNCKAVDSSLWSSSSSTTSTTTDGRGQGGMSGNSGTLYLCTAA